MKHCIKMLVGLSIAVPLLPAALCTPCSTVPVTSCMTGLATCLSACWPFCKQPIRISPAEIPTPVAPAITPPDAATAQASLALSEEAFDELPDTPVVALQPIVYPDEPRYQFTLTRAYDSKRGDFDPESFPTIELAWLEKDGTRTCYAQGELCGHERGRIQFTDAHFFCEGKDFHHFLETLCYHFSRNACLLVSLDFYLDDYLSADIELLTRLYKDNGFTRVENKQNGMVVMERDLLKYPPFFKSQEAIQAEQEETKEAIL